MSYLRLKPGREKSILQGHPWIYSGSVDRVEGMPEPGDVVNVLAHDSRILGKAGYSPLSQIRARMWTWNPDEEVDTAFLAQRIRKAIEYRKHVMAPTEGNAFRLVHGESDGLPGLVVDRYADVLSVQLLSVGVDVRKAELVEILMELTGVRDVYERSDVEVRKLEGLVEKTGILAGDPPREVEIMENGIRFLVDIQNGQKTGFYLDQRRNRARVGNFAAGRRVLNCFCYTGGFTAYCLFRGAEQVVSIDSSADAIGLAKRNLFLNGITQETCEWMEADVFQALRKFRDQGRQFDMIILDPPKFAPTAARADRAARGYKDINLLAFKLLTPGGILATFSCSGGISSDLFQKIVAGAALDARVQAVVVERLAQAPDHPVALSFPEGEYLKGLICAVG